MFSDLLLSSFDAMSARIGDSPPSLYLMQCQVFVQNKLPVVLASIASSSFMIPTEQLLTEAWPRISPTLYGNGTVSVGKIFLHVCSLLHLISTETAATLADDGTATMSLPKGLYSKDDLVSQVEASHSRCHKLIEELLRNDGNASPISHAVVEVRFRGAAINTWS